MIIIGIDPGISGSICFFEDGKVIDIFEMPSMAEGKKNKKQVNGAQIYNEISLRIKNYHKRDIKVVRPVLAVLARPTDNAVVTVVRPRFLEPSI